MIMGTERFKDGQYEDALDWFLAVDRLVDSATLTAKIADCYYFLGRYRDAIRFEDQAEQMAPKWSGPPYIKALSYYCLGRLDDALASARRSCSLGFSGGCVLVDSLLQDSRRR